MHTPGSGGRLFVIVDGNTIRETRDKQEEAAARPKKRQRVGSDESEEEEEEEKTEGIKGSRGRVFPSFKPLEKDEEYYLDEDDAECIVRVENTLFKVHDYLLYTSAPIRDHCEKYGKTTDQRPIELLAATLEEFKALLWALYEAPCDSKLSPKLSQDHFTDACVNRTLSIASIAQKYHFQDLYNWSSTALWAAINNKVFMECCSSATLTRMVDIAVQCNFLSMIPAVEAKWSERVTKSGTPSVPAILAADRHNLRMLRGIAYYVHIQDMLDRQHTTSRGAILLRTDPKLNNGQVMRVLSGYMSLVNFWERFRQSPLPLPLGRGCSKEEHEMCVGTWEKRWGSAIGWKRIMGYNTSDVLALIACLRDQLRGDEELKRSMHYDCRSLGLEALRRKLEESREALTDHFFGCV